MKFLRQVISLLIVFFLGFWLASADILTGTQVGDVMEYVVRYLPDRSDLERWDILEPIPATETSDPATATEEGGSTVTLPISEDDEINAEIVETTIIDLVNDLRQEQGVQPVETNDMLRAAANIRAVETEEHFSHTRPDGTDAFTVFQEEGISYPYQTVGENLGMATYHLDEVGMAEFIFEGWVESEGHYQNMIREDFDEIGVGVHFDGEILYATQLFGTQR